MPEGKKYRVALFQHSAPPNDLGEMTEIELYGYLRVKIDEDTAKAVLFELETKGASAVEFEGSLGLKARVEIHPVQPK